jgi:hypothetical protein
MAYQGGSQGAGIQEPASPEAGMAWEAAPVTVVLLIDHHTTASKRPISRDHS